MIWNCTVWKSEDSGGNKWNYDKAVCLNIENINQKKMREIWFDNLKWGMQY